MARVLPFRRLGLRRRLALAAAGVCPRCHQGRIFSGHITMHPDCPVCGFHFEREHGYFTGAMYVSYALAVPVMILSTALVFLLAPQLSFEVGVGVAALVFIPFAPAIFRWSRIIWIHLEQTIDPSS